MRSARGTSAPSAASPSWNTSKRALSPIDACTAARSMRLAGCASNLQLLEFLLRGEQIALGALDDELARASSSSSSSSVAARARSHCGSRATSTGQVASHAPVDFERLHPGRAVLLAFELAGEHQIDVVGTGVRQQLDDGIGAARAGLARRQAHLDELARAEQRKVVRRGAHRVPVGHALDEMDFALVEARALDARADGVGGLAHEQRFIAGHQIGPGGLTCEVGRQSCRG